LEELHNRRPCPKINCPKNQCENFGCEASAKINKAVGDMNTADADLKQKQQEADDLQNGHTCEQHALKKKNDQEEVYDENYDNSLQICTEATRLAEKEMDIHLRKTQANEETERIIRESVYRMSISTRAARRFYSENLRKIFDKLNDKAEEGSDNALRDAHNANRAAINSTADRQQQLTAQTDRVGQAGQNLVTELTRQVRLHTHTLALTKQALTHTG
jgi:hypothetical protein